MNGVPFRSILQPYLADLIRRAVFPIPGITVKIAAIEQRSHFKVGGHADYTGIEIGADASADVDLDDYMVFDNNAERAVQFFQELIFRHYKSEAGPKPEFNSSDGLIQAAFTQRNAFEDFVQSAEGVPRDAFNVLSIAAQRSMNDKISIPTIRVAARTWFQRDKEGAIRSNPEAQDLLHWVIDEVIAHRRARAFLLKSNTRHGLIDALFDARLLHVIKRSISGQEEAGARYDAYICLLPPKPRHISCSTRSRATKKLEPQLSFLRTIIERSDGQFSTYTNLRRARGTTSNTAVFLSHAWVPF